MGQSAAASQNLSEKEPLPLPRGVPHTGWPRPPRSQGQCLHRAPIRPLTFRIWHEFSISQRGLPNSAHIRAQKSTRASADERSDFDQVRPKVPTPYVFGKRNIANWIILILRFGIRVPITTREREHPLAVSLKPAHARRVLCLGWKPICPHLGCGTLASQSLALT
jgi:hypothetical protein